MYFLSVNPKKYFKCFLVIKGPENYLPSDWAILSSYMISMTL